MALARRALDEPRLVGAIGPVPGRAEPWLVREATLESLEVLRELGSEIQWVRSYITEDKVYCVFIAPDEALIHAHARRLGVPVDRVSAVRRMMGPQLLQ